MSKAMVYAVNSSSQTGGSVNFGAPIRRFGCCCNVVNGNPVTNSVGYYRINSKLVFTATAGTLVATWYKDGLPVPGATTSLTTVANVTYTLEDFFVVREKCCCDDDSIYTLEITGVTPTITNAVVEVERL